MIDHEVEEKAKYLAWDILEPTLKVFFDRNDRYPDLSKIIARAVENVILEEWCKFNGETWG